jgi:predicted enzyme related to lactoylglutathione lyase
MPDDRHGMFHWNELATPDPDRAVAFFTSLVGWQVAPMAMPEGTYHVLQRDGEAAGGIMAMPAGLPPGTPAHWLSYLAVDDVDAVCRRTAELGGRVLRQPWDIPGVGRIAVIADPTGAALGVITPASRR